MSIFGKSLKNFSLPRIFEAADEKPSPSENRHVPLAPQKPASSPQPIASGVTLANNRSADESKVAAVSPQRTAETERQKAQDKPRKRVPPVSIRFTADERARLEREAAGMSLSGHIREKLFAGKAAPRKTRGRYPVKDHQALARVLSALGRSKLYNSLHRIVLAVEEGRCPLDSDLERDLRDALRHVDLMRVDLVAALGQKPE